MLRDFSRSLEHSRSHCSLRMPAGQYRTETQKGAENKEPTSADYLKLVIKLETKLTELKVKSKEQSRHLKNRLDETEHLLEAAHKAHQSELEHLRASHQQKLDEKDLIIEEQRMRLEQLTGGI